MVVASSGVSGVADVSNHIALSYVVSFGESRSVAPEVSVIKDFLIWTKLIDSRSTPLALTQFHNSTICGGQYSSSRRRRNIDRIV